MLSDMNQSFNATFHEADIVKGKPFFGSTFAVLKNPLNFLIQLTKKYKAVVVVRFGCKKYFILQHPDFIKHVLHDNHKNYQKIDTTKLLSLFLGDGLTTSTGELWLRQRRIVQPAFHKQKMNAIFNVINEETNEFILRLKNLDDKTCININHELMQLTIAIISRSMFGISLIAEMNEMIINLEKMTNFASSRMKRLVNLPMYFPSPANKQFKKSLQKFNNLVYQIIEKRRNELATENELSVHDDLLDMLLHYQDDETNLPMDKKLIRDEVTTIFMAGHETTAQSLSWILYHLAKDKLISQKINAEAEMVSGDNFLSFDSIAQLTYSKQVIQETLRCYPPIWAFVRSPICDDTIHSIKIPAQSNVLLNIYGLLHHAEYWESPESFNPEHFNSENEKKRPPYVFIPFGAGPRVCIGQNFAMMIMHVVVNRLVKDFEFTIPEGFVPEVEPNITLRAKKGIQLILNKKN